MEIPTYRPVPFEAIRCSLLNIRSHCTARPAVCLGFDRFNLAHFRTVDQVIRQIEQAKLGLKTIMGESGVESPFNNPHTLVAGQELHHIWLDSGQRRW